jgi:hypothetical protein
VGTFTANVTGTSGELTHFVVVTFNITSPSAKPILLSFKGFDLDDYDNGVGQLQVFVNGHLAVDIPAGLNHLTGSGDFYNYTDRVIGFGPFDITSYVVNGQNNVTFADLDPQDHFGIIFDVSIVQGTTVLLHVPRFAPVFPDYSVTYTFSIPPLVITSFTVSNLNPVENQNVTFTATYTGGTGPFRCIFTFGDGEHAVVTGTNGTCSVVHDYDHSRTFHASVTIVGASTSDLVTSHLLIKVTRDPSPETSATIFQTTDDD